MKFKGIPDDIFAICYPEKAEARRQKQRDACKAWRAANREKARAATKAWQQKNKEHVRVYALATVEARRKRGKKWADKNKPKLAAKAARRRATPRGMLEERLRLRLSSLIRNGMAARHSSALRLCGCSVDILIGWIESKFLLGMNWGNRREWEIDHKIPCVAFDLMSEAGQKACFHYTNLQPLWRSQNRIKGARIIQLAA